MRIRHEIAVSDEFERGSGFVEMGEEDLDNGV